MEENNEVKKSFNLIEFIDEFTYALRTIVISSVCIFMIFHFLFTPVVVDGPSMTPTLLGGQWGFSSLLSNYLHSYNRFDVVVVQYNDDTKLVKRIIGLPGEVIEYKQDKLYVNGEYVEEKYFDKEYIDRNTYGGTVQFTDDFGPVYVGEDEYFLMGDNRPHSTDSRTLGTFNKDEIFSKSMLVLWPINEIRFVGKG